VAFLHQLRVELAFYIGCMNLHHRLTAVGMPLCRPTPEAAMTSMLDAEDLYDPCLALVTNAPVVPNDLPATGKGLVVITGANQGGKSTLLRALGLAQVMSQCGMLVAARHYRSSVRDQIFTHYKREEDDGLELGKLDEELVRMRRITDHVSPASLVLCNESFASTNESEGSEIGHQILRALTEAGTTVVFVTHLHELALRLWHDEDETRLFLRADRGDQGRRTYRLVAGRPLPTSFGADTFAKVFCETLPRSTR
jgi:DNA mismatch repair ATPase MutS